MASSNTVLMQLVASVYSIAQKAGTRIRYVIAEGDLGIVQKDLPPGEVDQELIEDGQWEEIPKQPCPSQYSAIKEKDLVVWVDSLDGT